jgi:hypothetical protein
MKKTTYVLGVVVLLAALLALPGVSQSAMWVGAELGGNFSVVDEIDVGGVNAGSAKPSPAVIGGVTIGYDFVNAGFGAYAWPEWMKYFSFATDITYNRLNVNAGGSSTASFQRDLPDSSRLTGSILAWTFLFMAHYGFFPDSEVPSGRVNPYIGVGPAIVFSSVDFSLPVPARFRTANTNSRVGGSGVNVALVVEPGIRWVVLKNVSIDTAFRYRYAVPSWDIDNVTVKANPINMLAFLIRANYHF